jgi:hypothetical protein
MCPGIPVLCGRGDNWGHGGLVLDSFRSDRCGCGWPDRDVPRQARTDSGWAQRGQRRGRSELPSNVLLIWRVVNGRSELGPARDYVTGAFDTASWRHAVDFVRVEVALRGLLIAGERLWQPTMACTGRRTSSKF